MSNVTYFDFAQDDMTYLMTSYNSGLRFSAMVLQAHRICELTLKHLINIHLINNSKVMMSRNLRKIYDYCTEMGIDLESIRADVLVLNNLFEHTRYPMQDSYLAPTSDVDAAVSAIIHIWSSLLGELV